MSSRELEGAASGMSSTSTSGRQVPRGDDRASEGIDAGPAKWLGSLAELDPTGPYRAPDWRVRLVEHLRQFPRSRLRRIGDDAVRKAYVYRRDLDRRRSEDGRRKVIEAAPEVHAAFELASTGPFFGPRREVEARLLAGQDDRTIADRCGLTPEAVGAFADLFFDVRPRLSARSYILHVAIGRIEEGRPVELDADRHSGALRKPNGRHKTHGPRRPVAWFAMEGLATGRKLTWRQKTLTTFWSRSEWFDFHGCPATAGRSTSDTARLFGSHPGMNRYSRTSTL